jgi:hypothetical protein
LTDEVLVEAMVAWENIFVHRNYGYLQNKAATIQNPTICYYAAFLAYSLFGRGDTRAIAGSDISVLHMALLPGMVNKVNLGTFLIQHFHRQRSLPSGDIRCGDLVTQIAYTQGWSITSVWPVEGSKYMDRNHMANTIFMGVDASNHRRRAYQFSGISRR